MKVTYRHGNTEFTQECANRKDAFDFIGAISDAFPAEPCGCCGKTNTVPRVRKAGQYTFHEIACADCTATLNIVFLDDGRVFPGRSNKNKEPLPNKGWSVYKKDGNAAPNENPEPGKQSDRSDVPF